VKSAADVNHGSGRLEEAGLSDVMAGFLALHSLENVVAQFRVIGAASHAPVQVVFDLREKAGADFAVGREADAAARAAEGLGHRGDDANFAHAIRKGVTTCGFAGFARSEVDEGQHAADAIYDFSQRNDDAGRPQAAFFQRHEFNKAHHDIFMTGEVSKAFDLVVIEAAQQDAIDLERRETSSASGADAAQHGFKATGNASDALECRRIDGVHADGDALQARGFKRRCQRVEKMAVGGEGQVKRVAGKGAKTSELLDKLYEAAAQERFSTREPDLGDAEIDKELDEPQVLLNIELGILRSDFSRSAVNAFVVAAIGDGDAQIVDGSPMTVSQPRVGKHRRRKGWGDSSHPQVRGYTVPIDCAIWDAHGETRFGDK